jgi:hypothetical protein
MLIFVLALIIVISVFGVAVLNQTANAPAAHSAYQGVRSIEVGSDLSADGVIQALRNAGEPSNSFAASSDYGGKGGCNNYDQERPLNNPSTGNNLYTYTDAQGGSRQVLLYCETTKNSFGPPVDARTPPPSPVTALGGMMGSGNQYAAAATVASTAPYGTQNPAYWYPFCDDWEKTGQASPRCEAGIFVGRAVASDNLTGGLHIEGNAATSPGQYLVQSNSSIIVQTGNDPNRTLTADGSIFARRGCGSFNNVTNVWNSIPTPPTSWGTSTNVASSVGAAPSTSYNCATSYTTPGANWTGSPSSNLIPDPTLVHEPLDLTAQCNGTPCIPRVDSTASTTNCTAFAYNASYGGTASSTSCRIPATTITSCPSSTGYYVMPARQIGVQAASTTPASTTPVFGAWYDSAAELTNLMKICKSTVLHFRPGLYYFDFLDTASPTSWQAPAGCFPVTATCTPSQIIGGLWPKDPKTGAAEWTPYTSGGAPAQAPKVMTTNKVTPTNSTVWTEYNKVTNAVTQAAATGNGALGALQIDDDQYAAIPVYAASGYRFPEIDGGQLQQPIPESGVTSIDSLTFQVAYQATQPANAHASTLYAPDDPAQAGGFVEVQIKAAGSSTSYCDLKLPVGPYMGIDQFANPSQVASTSFPQSIDLSKGCPITVNGGVSQGGAMNPYFIKATGIFAPSGPCDSLHVVTVAQCGAFAGWNGTNEPYINQLGANFLAATQTTAVQGDGLTVGLDGMQFVASWHGPPAPTFPNGCDGTLPGVQFVFGGDSRIDWGQGGSDFFGELCASSQDTFPNWDNDPLCAANTYHQGTDADPLNPNSWDPTKSTACNFHDAPVGHNYGIAIYGLSDGTSPPPSPTTSVASQPIGQILSSDQLGTSASPCTTNICANATDTSPTFTAPSANNPANYYKAGDGLQQISNPWNGATDQSLAFNFPTNLVCTRASYGSSWPGACPANTIPEGSFITNVKFTMKYHEGDWNTSTTPTSWIAGYGPNSSFVPDLCMQMHVYHSGGATVGSNGYISSDWDSSGNFPCAANGPGLPRCTLGNGGTTYSQLTPPATANTPPNCTLRYGDMNAANDTQQSGANADNTSYANTLLNQETVWPAERDLTDALASPEGIQGAEVKLTTHATANVNNYNHQAAVDGLVFTISYRAAGDPRPARGCETIRTELPPGVLVPQGSDVWQASQSVPKQTDMTQPNPTNGGAAYDWLDSDWGYKPSGNASSLQTDQPFQDTSGSSAGNGLNDDTQDCAIFGFDTTGSGGSPSSKLHIQGMIYAPSTALYLTGNDNDAPWVTDALIARQITAFKWSKGGGQPSVAGTAPPKSPRYAIIEARDPNNPNTVWLRVTATINDDWSNWPQVVYGSTITINSWNRSPSS